MQNSITLRRHAELVDRMATTLGIDLEQKVMEGQLRSQTIADAVLSCTGCSCANACERWLDMQHSPADAPPTICRNTDLFMTLKASKRA